MLPRSALACETVGSELFPRWLSERDEPWLAALLDEHARYTGERRAELAARLREPLSPAPPKKKLEAVACVLEKMTHDRTEAAVPPVDARRLVFEAAARHGQAALAKVSEELGIGEDQLAGSLFADLPSERRVRPLPTELTPGQLSRITNQELAGSLLARSTRVSAELVGHARQVVRHAQRVGLLCVATEAQRDAVRLEVSGPLALFRHTRVYGRALASLVPRLAWCDSFRLVADVDLGNADPQQLLLTQSDPIFVSGVPPPFESPLEERFVRDMCRASKSWDIVREPTALSIGGRLVFPDFELRHRKDDSRRVLVEIVGYWTPEYLQEKLRAIGERSWILCASERRGSADRSFPGAERILWFKGRIDPRAVLERLG
ncbi:MAG: DUF790 family protein [Myxococcales bacterium]|nr:DUF790 family protein [Myxococcales bacterium]MCB9579003.1 DUF790 family protein [Polyangiaceae bacterium]